VVGGCCLSSEFLIPNTRSHLINLCGLPTRVLTGHDRAGRQENTAACDTPQVQGRGQILRVRYLRDGSWYVGTRRVRPRISYGAMSTALTELRSTRVTWAGAGTALRVVIEFFGWERPFLKLPQPRVKVVSEPIAQEVQ
jgi:hypothetical protein